MVVNHFTPPAKFIDAALEEGVNIDGVVQVRITETLVVSPSRSKEAVEIAGRIAEQAREEARKDIDEIRKQLKRS